MKQFFLSILLITFAAPALAAPEKYTFDPQHTNINWYANHMGFSNPSGKFIKAEGTLVLDEAKPENSKVEATIYPGSILTGIEKFDAHLRGKDFMHAEKFPTARFVSTQVEVLDATRAKVHGKLTLRGITKPVVLNVTLNKIANNPMSGKKTAGFSAMTVIKRSEFGMDYGLPNVADEVPIDIELEAIKK